MTPRTTSNSADLVPVPAADAASITLTADQISRTEAMIASQDNPVTKGMLEKLWEKVKSFVPAQPLNFPPFQLRDDGVWKLEDGTDPNDPKKQIRVWNPVCAWLRVVAHSRHEHNKSWGKVLRWRDRDGQQHTYVASEGMLIAPGNAIAQILAAGGLRIREKRWGDVEAYIRAVEIMARMRSVPRTGWHTAKSGRVFITPDRVIGPGSEEVVFHSESFSDEHRMIVEGSVADWQQHVAKYCVGNNLLTFAASVAFAAPTLRLLSEAERTTGFHLYGDSSKGKTTALAVAASVWGYKVGRWDITINQVENVAEYHNDVLLTFDELKQVAPEHAAQIVYKLSQDGGKERMEKDSGSQRTREWKVLYLSTGEISLLRHVEAAGKNLEGGASVRLVHVPGDAGAGMGSFETIHHFQRPDEFADYLTKDATLRHRGAAGAMWIELLVAKADGVVAAITAMRKQFVAKNVPAGASGEIYRVANRFGVIAAAGELARHIAGWESGVAWASAEWCFRRWLDARSSITGAADADKSVRDFRLWLFGNKNRFENLDIPELRPIPHQAGWCRLVDGAVEYWIQRDVFTDEACRGSDPQAALTELQRRGYLHHSPGRKQIQHQINGVMTWVYAVRATIFGDEGDDGLISVPKGD